MISTQLKRSGLSVIEVLTSIVVAMIGVFGVLAMIPFAVQQTQSGLDRDGATVLARNGMAEMEIRGYRAPENWLVASGNPVDTTDPTERKPYSIDPLAVMENLPLGDYTTTAFPYNVVTGANPNYPVNYLISPASLVRFDGGDMTLAGARRMFRGRDELSLGELTDEMEGPNPLFDAITGSDVARRQSVGSLSWSALMVPFKPTSGIDVQNAWSFRSYVIVYKDRVVDSSAIDSRMFSTQVNPAAHSNFKSPIGTINLVGKTFPAEYPFAKGDWVMLINRKVPVSEGGITEDGFQFQVAFYRIINYKFGGPGNSILENVTLDGPDFDFGNSTAEWDMSRTHMVHLRNVIAVYERDIVHEEQSTWNLDR